jgi:CheY-like chemotaxis protein
MYCEGIIVLQILLAEDNEGDVILVEQALAEHNIDHELHVVRDGDEALDYLAGMGKPEGPPCPDVLLLDLNLPKVDGPQVLQQFRKHPACTQTPVIIVTSSDAPQDRKRAKVLGANAYFRKPSDLMEFMALGTVIQEVLGRVVETF